MASATSPLSDGAVTGLHVLSRSDILQAELALESDRHIDSLKLLSQQEERQLLFDWNITQADYPEQACIHRLFEAQAALTPHAIAVRFERSKLSYRELDTVSNCLARFLQGLGAGPDVLVGICVGRSERMVAALLAILKTGAAYVPFDPDHPAERLSFMARDSAIRVLVTEERFTGLFPDFSGTVIRLDADWKRIKAETSQPVKSKVGSRNLAWVIYTSGSTGKPNGVMIEHRSVVNFMLSMRREPGLGQNDRLFSVTTLSFDIAALEIFLPLLAGAELIVASRKVAGDGTLLGKELSRSGATVMQATPATWRMLLESNWPGQPGLKALCGGEALPRELANELVRRTDSVWNLYGPTETTIWSTTIRIDEGDGPVPIGSPVANTRIYILDRLHRPVPIGVPGELYIAGDGVARGYWCRPELTAQRFVELPFEKCRVYKTGDNARYRSDGSIEYLGRRDFQVKLRGYRIELSEIESALRRLDGINEAAVVVRGEDARKQLVAYLECEQDNAPGPPEIRHLLQASLPEYMVPSSYVVLEGLPLTPNGKIDRKALPEPQSTGLVQNAFIAPRDRVELQLAEIWEEVLGIKPIGTIDNFFDLGGHSLLAMRLISRIETVMGYNLPLAQLFGTPTIESLSNAIRAQTWENSWSTVIELQRGTANPFFCIHSLGANLVTYRKLAKLSGPDQQFYGLQPYGLDGKQEPHTSIEDMARAYLIEIRRIQPKGPYRIGGVCLGGVIAFEMAQQLIAEGQEVTLLLLIDCEFQGIPEHLHIAPRWLRGVDALAGELFRLSLPAFVSKWARSMFDYAISNWRGLPSPANSSLMRARRRVMNLHLRALFNYIARQYPGKVTLFCCTGRNCRAYGDRRLAWSQVSGGGLEVHLIPGNHITMLDHPHVEAMAGKLRECLERAGRVEECATGKDLCARLPKNSATIA